MAHKRRGRLLWQPSPLGAQSTFLLLHQRCGGGKVLLRYFGYLKGKSALMIFDKYANLKYKFGNRHFWAEGYYVSIVGLNEATIRKYIEDQEKHDIAVDKLNVKEYEAPFKGGK